MHSQLVISVNNEFLNVCNNKSIYKTRKNKEVHEEGRKGGTRQRERGISSMLA